MVSACSDTCSVVDLCDQGLVTDRGMRPDYNFSSVTCEKNASNVTHCRFSPSTLVSSCSNTGSIRDDPYWTSRENSLELIELSSINKVSLV